MEDDTLRDEVERLQAENEALRRRGVTRERLRRGSVVALLILGCGLAALSVVAIWLRVTLLDTDRYVRTVAPIAAQPAVQDAVADRLNTAIDEKIDFASLFREALPGRTDVLAPALESGLQSFLHTRVEDFTHSERFETLWVEANRRAHTRVTELLTGGRSGNVVLDEDIVYLDLSPVIDRVKQGLTDRGLTRVAAAIPPTVDGRIQLFQSEALVQAQTGVRLVKGIAILLPFLSLLCLAGSIFLSKSRRRGLLQAGIGVALAMLLLIAALGIARSAYLDSLGAGALPRDAASQVFDTVGQFLRDGVRIVVFAAVLLAIVAFLFGLPLEKVWHAIVTDQRRKWVAGHREPLLITVAGVGGVALLARNPLTGGYVAVVLIVAALAAGIITALALQPGTDVADEVGAEHEHQPA